MSLRDDVVDWLLERGGLRRAVGGQLYVDAADWSSPKRRDGRHGLSLLVPVTIDEDVLIANWEQYVEDGDGDVLDSSSRFDGACGWLSVTLDELIGSVGVELKCGIELTPRGFDLVGAPPRPPVDPVESEQAAARFLSRIVDGESQSPGSRFFPLRDPGDGDRS